MSKSKRTCGQCRKGFDHAPIVENGLTGPDAYALCSRRCVDLAQEEYEREEEQRNHNAWMAEAFGPDQHDFSDATGRL